MIRSFISSGKKYSFIPPEYGVFSTSNCLTVIVGKNGTGKSRLLQGIIQNLLQSSHGDFEKLARERQDAFKRESLNSTKSFKKIICVSTSPYDRFPVLRLQKSLKNYAYLGLRGLPSQYLSNAYISRIIAALISSIFNDPQKSSNIGHVLDYLGYEKHLECSFYLEAIKKLDAAEEAEDPVGFITGVNARGFRSSEQWTVSQRLLDEASNTELFEVIQILKRLSKNSRKRRLELKVEQTGISFAEEEGLHINEAVMLVKTGAARLRDIKLQKKMPNGKFRQAKIVEASSGEQAVIMGMLGIASQIEDNSLVCIDEPEICLHPEWQEKYIHLLFETFENKKGCQFLLATHSPQIVAELPQNNCFVMSMEDGIPLNSSNFSHRSVDFQLANVFKSPGRNNEYLNRNALNLFASVSENKRFSEVDKQNLEFLKSIRPFIRESDPILQLIDAIAQMGKLYG